MWKDRWDTEVEAAIEERARKGGRSDRSEQNGCGNDQSHQHLIECKTRAPTAIYRCFFSDYAMLKRNDEVSELVSNISKGYIQQASERTRRFVRPKYEQTSTKQRPSAANTRSKTLPR
jgi:hypothetical protein